MIILGIETSFDETGIAIYEKQNGIIINEIYSQKKIHYKYGGIIPELAAKNHLKIIIPLLKKTLKKSKIKINKINAIAYTAGPGLSNSLLIGATTAVTLSYLYNIPHIPVNHIEGHIMSIMLNRKKTLFPFLSLVASGANTQLTIVYNFEKYKIIGKSLDDSAGELFDKTAYMLNIKYPTGNELSKLAKFGKKHFIFPKPIINKKNFNFSFSGLKTHIKKIIKNNTPLTQENKNNIAYSLENTIAKILVTKSKKALNKYKIKKIAISGGVARNNTLIKKMKIMTKKLGIKTLYPPKKICTDNAAMIAYIGLIKLNKKNYKFIKDFKIKINSKWKINKSL